MKLTLPLPPTINTYWRSIIVGKGKKARAMPILSREARAYQAEMRLAVKAMSFDRIDGPCALTAWFYRPRRAGDVDGRLKPLLDALQGFAYVNDSQLQEIHAYNGHDPLNPRVEVEVVACLPVQGVSTLAQ